MRVGVIGLGLTGIAFAKLLLRKGYDIYVWNRTSEKASSVLDLGARWSDYPMDECDRLLFCLYDANATNMVLDQMASHFREGQTVIDTSTACPTQVTLLDKRCLNLGVKYIVSPVSGSSRQIENREGIAFVGGDVQTYQHNIGIFQDLFGESIYFGVPEKAAIMKLVSNIVLGLNRAALAEALSMAECLGMDPYATLQALKQSATYSRVMDTKGTKMVQRDYAVQAKVSQHAKDITLALKIGTANGCFMPMSQLHIQLLHSLEERGFGESDNSAIIEAFAKHSPQTSGD